MRKLLVLLLMVTMSCSVAACGGDKSDDAGSTDISSVDSEKIDAQDVVDKVLEEAEERNSFSPEAVDYYLRNGANLSLEAVAPDWEYIVKDYGAYADDPSNGYGHAVIEFTKQEGELTDDEYNAWLQKVFAATAAASQDGYNVIGYEFAGEGEDALSETTLEDAIGGFMSGWAYRYNDKLMVVYVSEEYDSEKESESGSLFYYCAVNVDIGVGLQKSFDDTMSEMEEYFEENEDEIKEAIEDYIE